MAAKRAKGSENLKKDKKPETPKELAAAGLAVAPHDNASARWETSQYLRTGIEWQDHLEQLRRAGERMRREDPGADADLWTVILVHTGGYVFSYYRCRARITHEHYTTEDRAGQDPVWVISEKIKREVKLP